MEFIEDCKALVSQIKQQDKELRLKRRWLMNLEVTREEAKQMKQHMPTKDKFLLESLLREDDLYYDDIRACIEKGFLAGCVQKEQYGYQKKEKDEEDENYVQLFNSRDGLKDIFSMLDDMTNKGLCCFTEILTGGSVNFEKTKWQMKKMIKESLPAILESQMDNSKQKISQVSQLLREPKTFRANNVASATSSKNYCASARMVLNELQGLPFQTLSSMHRKVKGVRGYIPQMQPQKSGWSHGDLTKQVRKRCTYLLSGLGEGDLPPEPLANALAVAGLTLKLKATSFPVMEFRTFSAETEALQNEIIKAIKLLDGRKVVFAELKEIMILLCPNAKSSKRIRVAIRNLLIEYLLECADMETIPECLLQALAIINKRAQASICQSFSKKDVEEEVECVLAVSAQTKQVIWDLLSDHEHAFDQEFENAYAEDMLEGDDGSFSDDDHQSPNFSKTCRFDSDDSNYQIESIGETSPVVPELPASTSKECGFSSLLSPCRRVNIKIEECHINEIDSVLSSGFPQSSVTDTKSFGNSTGMKREENMGELTFTNLVPQLNSLGTPSLPFSPHGRSNKNEHGEQETSSGSAKTFKYEVPDFTCRETQSDDKQRIKRNEYLAVQEACDKTSMVAYHIIGRMLNELAEVEGLELHQDDISYLRGNNNYRASKRRQTSDDDTPILFNILDELSEEELMLALPDSGREKLKKLMGMK